MSACKKFLVIFRALPHSLQTYSVRQWAAASANCSLWEGPLSSFLLWASLLEAAGRSSSPAWCPPSSEERERKIISVNAAAFIRKIKNRATN